MESNDVVTVDGAMLEGGGQLFRMSISLAYIFKKRVRIHKIRANRPKGGGMASQHLTGLQSVVNMIPGCNVSGNTKGSTEVEFYRGSNAISRTDYTADCKTPGAVALILQMLMPCLLFQKEAECNLTILGGTMVGMSPTTHPIEHVLLPVMRSMGVEIGVDIQKHGFCPNIVGEASFKIGSLKQCLTPLTMTERGGSIVRVAIYVQATIGEASAFYEKTFKQSLVDYLSGFALTFEEGFTAKQGKAETLAVSAVLIFPNQTMLHCDVLVEGANRLTKQDWAKQLSSQVQSLAVQEFTVDEHHCDQILVYCALAQGVSQFTTTKQLSLHTQTMLVLLPMFCPVKISIQSEDTTVVTIEGLNLFN